MKASAKSLLPSLLMLYLPILLVGGIGLSEIRTVEQELRDFRSHAEPLLDGASKEFDYELDAELFKALAKLRDGLELPEILQRLEDIPTISQGRPDADEGRSAVRFSFLLPRSLRTGGRLRPIYPKSGMSRSPRRTNRRLSPSVTRRVRDRVRHADYGGGLRGAIDAIEHLEALPETAFTKPEDEAYLRFHLGSWMTKADQWKKASASFKAGRQALEHGERTEFYLYLDLLLAELRSLDHEAGQAADPIAFEPLLRKHLIRKLIGGMARGEFDAETKSLLDWRLDRTMVYAKPLLAADNEFAQDVQADLIQRELHERHREEARSILRHLQFLQQGKLVDLEKLARDQGKIMTLPYRQAGGASMIAIQSIRAEAANGDTRNYYSGVLVDLASLLEPTIGRIEERLGTLGNPYRLELIDEDGRSILDSIRTPMDGETRTAAAEIATTLRLRDRFKDFALEALPMDPEAITEAERLRVWLRIAMLVALLIMAFGAAYLFVRTVKKEREFAELRTGFVARVSHELKTPLSLIRMYGETLAMGRVPDPEKACHFAGIIAQESDRLSRMIDNVLDFSQVGAGTKGYNKKDLRLDLHIADLLESYAPHLQAQGFELKTQTWPALRAEVDPEALTQALVNLLGNARKYTPDDGDKQIEIHLSKVGHQAWIEIMDRGVGVPEDERNRIFETFYRAKTSEERRGAGLGLALVMHFAQHHGGSVECLGRMGGGSVFRIRLPLTSSVGTGSAGNVSNSS